MTRLQFRVLYREFLFRMVDLELLSAQGDITKLLGQFAGLLIFISVSLGLGALIFDTRKMNAQKLVTATWGIEHFLIATTMLVVGLFAVLSWDSTFPDRRDVLVLAPLPIRPRTLFLAKVAALATALSLTVAALNGFSGITWPLMALTPVNSGLIGLVRTLAAYWITVLAAGAFIFCSLLAVQGLAAQLPRRRFLRLAAFLQMAAFCLFLCVYFLQPQLATPGALAAPQNQRTLAWLPSYWFLGLFQVLNGSLPEEGPGGGRVAIVLLARRASLGLVIAGFSAGAAFLLSYFRTLRKIVEEPDIVPGARGAKWPLRFGNALQTAVVQFSIRTLLRSRQHRVILAFYLGIGFAITILLLQPRRTPQHLPPQSGLGHPVSVPLLIASLLMLGFWVVGTRVMFALPLDLRANWIFRIAPIRGARECLSASRRSLIVLSVAPACAGSSAVLLAIWPWQVAVGHLVILGLVGVILADICLHGFEKIPFTCSYLPGKTQAHMAIWAVAPILGLVFGGAQLERRALEHPGTYARMVVVLGVAAACARWRTAAQAKSEDADLQFEEEDSPAIFVLGLNRDGIVPIPDPEN